jgi:hypothetical protein
MTLDEIKDRFKGTAFEEAIGVLCDMVGVQAARIVILDGAVERLQQGRYETDRPKANKPN